MQSLGNTTVRRVPLSNPQRHDLACQTTHGCMMYDTVRPFPTYRTDVYERWREKGRLKLVCGQMPVPFRATSLAEADQRQQQGTFLRQKWVSRSCHVRRWEGFCTGHHRFHFSYCKSNVFINVGRKGLRFPTAFRCASYRLRRNAMALWRVMSAQYGYATSCVPDMQSCHDGRDRKCDRCYWYPRAYLTEF